MPSIILARRTLFLLAALTIVFLVGALAVAILIGLPAGCRDAELTDSGASQSHLGAGLGVNLETSELLSPDLGQQLETLSAAGVRWIRFTLPWDQIEPAPGRCEWQAWDHALAELAAHPDLQLLVVLNGSPGWARRAADVGNSLAPPQERSAFGAFVTAVAARYGGQVRYYQIWHEPNIAPHWGAQHVNPADYAGLLREAAVQIRAADTDAQIVLAALAPTLETGGANLSDIAYLEALYEAGAKEWFDIVAAQPYGFDSQPDEAADASRLNFNRVLLLRQVMLRYDDAASPLWVTAFGWHAARSSQAPAASAWGAVSERAQADYAAQSLEIGARYGSWLGPVFWAAFCPERPATDPWLGFALCTDEGAFRPAWEALTAATPTAQVLSPGRHRTDHPALSYSPGWRVTGEAADPGADGDTLTFVFHGSGLSLRVQGGPYWAFFRIWVDGTPANRLPRDESGAAYLVLHDPEAAERIIKVAEGLPFAEHGVVVEATGGWGQWALRELIVAPEATGPTWLFWLLAALGLGSAIALGRAAWPYRRTGARKLLSLAGHLSGCMGRAAWVAAIGLLAILLLSNRTVIDLVALLILALLFLLRPDLPAPLIAASLPFWQRPELLGPWQFSHFEILTALGALALGSRMALLRLADQDASCVGSGTSRVHSGPRRSEPWWAAGHRLVRSLDWPLLGLVVSGLVSCLIAREQGVAWREWRIVFLGAALFYWVVTRTPAAGGQRFSPWPLIAGLLAGMVAASALGLWQLLTGHGRVDVEGVWRVRALYGSPNNLALLLGRGVPVALALAAFSSSGAGLRPEVGKDGAGKAGGHRLLRLACAVAAGVMAAACVATFSKGALLLALPAGLATVLAVGAWRTHQRWPLVVLAGLALAGGAGLVLLFRTPRFADLFNFEAGTSFLRLKLWQGAWNMALDHPLLGVGPDNFLYAYRTHYVLPSAWQELNLSHPHNLFLDLWTRLGLVGLVVGLWGLAAAFRSGWSLLQGCGKYWPLVLGLLAGLAATVAHGLIDNSLFLVDLMGVYVITLGLFRRLEVRCAS